MKQMELLPGNWPCRLDQCPPGPFVTVEHPDLLCFKTEHREDGGRVTAYNSAGEFFCGEGNATLVIPVSVVVTTD